MGAAKSSWLLAMIVRQVALSAIVALWVRHATGQFIPSDIKPTGAANTSKKFVPPFPVNCRPIDFDQWSAFEGGEETIGNEGIIRCSRLHGDSVNNKLGHSAESQKQCKQSLKDYAEWQKDPSDAGSRRMWCDVAHMNKDIQIVKMRHYLESKLVSSAIVADHDVKAQFFRWLDTTNLRLADQWGTGYLAGTEMPQVSDACANAYGNYMCSNMLLNCTYMPWARWPYQEQFEKIYVCKEVCEEVRKYCDAAWIPHEMRCTDLISNKIDLALDPTMTEMTPYERR